MRSPPDIVRLGFLGLSLVACDAGPEGGVADGDVGDATTSACESGVGCCSDRDCSNRVYCDGLERCVEGACVPGEPIVCDDGVACTEDRCDEDANLCVFEADHDRCDDGDFCNGQERCDPTHEHRDQLGCIAGPPALCDDGDECTADVCRDGRCQVSIRDLDRDGAPDGRCALCDEEGRCARGTDCDDEDPDVRPDALESCADGRDNDCDGLTDYADESCSIANDGCSSPSPASDGEVVFASTRGATSDVDDGCAPEGALDVVFGVLVREPADLVVEVVSRYGSNLYVAVTAECGVAAASSHCLRGPAPELWLRGAEPGTYYVVVSTSGEVDFTVRAEARAPSARAEGDVCSEAIVLPEDDAAHRGSFADGRRDYHLECTETWEEHVDLVHVVTLSAERSLAPALRLVGGSGRVALALRDECGLPSTTRACFSGDGEAAGSIPLLPPGRYFLVAAHDGDGEYELDLGLAPLAPELVLFEDFTDDAEGWMLEGAWEQGIPVASREPSPVGGRCLATVVGGDYPAGMSHGTDYVQSPELDLRSATSPVLVFRSWLSTAPDGYSGARVEARPAGGEWAVVEDVVPGYDTATLTGPEWLGPHEEWATWRANLTSYAGTTMSLRFSAYSEPWVREREPGWYIDNVAVLEAPAPPE